MLSNLFHNVAYSGGGGGMFACVCVYTIASVCMCINMCTCLCVYVWMCECMCAYSCFFAFSKGYFAQKRHHELNKQHILFPGNHNFCYNFSCFFMMILAVGPSCGLQLSSHLKHSVRGCSVQVDLGLVHILSRCGQPERWIALPLRCLQALLWLTSEPHTPTPSHLAVYLAHPPGTAPLHGPANT